LNSVFSEFIHVNKFHFCFKFLLRGSFDGNFRFYLFFVNFLQRCLLINHFIIIPGAIHLDYNFIFDFRISATYDEGKLVVIKSIKMHGLFVFSASCPKFVNFIKCASKYFRCCISRFASRISNTPNYFA